jgi:hypothetical protein
MAVPTWAVPVILTVYLLVGVALAFRYRHGIIRTLPRAWQSLSSGEWRPAPRQVGVRRRIALLRPPASDHWPRSAGPIGRSRTIGRPRWHVDRRRPRRRAGSDWRTPRARRAPPTKPLATSIGSIGRPSLPAALVSSCAVTAAGRSEITGSGISRSRQARSRA